jgi:hypothetical protein
MRLGAHAARSQPVTWPPTVWITLLYDTGVEIGQLAIVAVFLPVAFALRKTKFYRVGVLKAGSTLVAILAGWSLLQRMFDL